MRILLLTLYCTPEPNFKSVPLAKELRGRGHDVRILTGFPYYPGGKLYAGYRIQLCRRDLIDGVPVTRIPVYPSHDRSSARRMISYGSLAASSLLPLSLGWKPDVIYAHGLPTLGWAAWTANALRGVPYVFDLQDLWPDAVLDSGMGKSWMRSPLTRFCRFVYREAAAMIVLSPGFKRTLIKWGVAEKRIHVIYNWCDEQILSFPQGPSPPPVFADRFNILYAGAMGRAQGLDVAVEAAAIVARQAPRVQFVLMGSGTEMDRLRHKAADIAPRHAVFLDRQPPGEAAATIRQAEAVLVSLRKAPRYQVTIPSKIQAYMAIGRPILASVEGDAADLVRMAHAGCVCSPGNPAAMARAAADMARLPATVLAGMGNNGATYYRQHLSMEHGIARTEAVLDQVVRRRS
jgi:glycosyltransferase involved in cell wall biosynthesis